MLAEMTGISQTIAGVTGYLARAGSYERSVKNADIGIR